MLDSVHQVPLLFDSFVYSILGRTAHHLERYMPNYCVGWPADDSRSWCCDSSRIVCLPVICRCFSR